MDIDVHGTASPGLEPVVDALRDVVEHQAGAGANALRVALDLPPL